MSRPLVGLALLLCWACERSSTPIVEEAEFGVFFGGQVQELKEISKELDAARQQHGIRLTFNAPLRRDLLVKWELSLPAGDKGVPRAAIVGEATATAGQARLDVPLAFRQSDPLGLWHAKVSADGRVVIDRDFSVIAPSPPPKTGNKPLVPRLPGSSQANP